MGSVQVGLTSGPGCDGAAQDYGYYLKLADKGILEQITVWLNHRGAVGQDENIQVGAECRLDAQPWARPDGVWAGQAALHAGLSLVFCACCRRGSWRPTLTCTSEQLSGRTRVYWWGALQPPSPHRPSEEPAPE